jgi:hypothetical protein
MISIYLDWQVIYQIKNTINDEVYQSLANRIIAGHDQWVAPYSPAHLADLLQKRFNEKSVAGYLKLMGDLSGQLTFQHEEGPFYHFTHQHILEAFADPASTEQPVASAKAVVESTDAGPEDQLLRQIPLALQEDPSGWLQGTTGITQNTSGNLWELLEQCKTALATGYPSPDPGIKTRLDGYPVTVNLSPLKWTSPMSQIFPRYFTRFAKNQNLGTLYEDLEKGFAGLSARKEKTTTETSLKIPAFLQNHFRFAAACDYFITGSEKTVALAKQWFAENNMATQVCTPQAFIAHIELFESIAQAEQLLEAIIREVRLQKEAGNETNPHLPVPFLGLFPKMDIQFDPASEKYIRFYKTHFTEEYSASTFVKLAAEKLTAILGETQANEWLLGSRKLSLQQNHNTPSLTLYL